MATLNGLIACLDDLEIHVDGVCYDSASNTLKSFKLLQGFDLFGGENKVEVQLFNI